MILFFGVISIRALAEDNVDYLDLETTTTKDIDQNYTFTQTSEEYTDVTKVKLTWTITDIEVTYTSNKTWDPDTLTWKETKTVGEIANKSAEFTLTNYSSKKVVGTVEFKVEDDLKDILTSYEFDENNGKEIDTVVNIDYTIDETKKANVPSNKITATLTFDASKFAELTATTSATKYGTYTVTITAAATPKITFNEMTYNAHGLTFTDNNIVLKGSTWEEVVNNNKDNTITICYGGNQANCKIVRNGDYVGLAIVGGGGTFTLFTSDSTTKPDTDNALKLTDSLCITLYIYPAL